MTIIEHICICRMWNECKTLRRINGRVWFQSRQCHRM